MNTIGTKDIPPMWKLWYLRQIGDRQYECCLREYFQQGEQPDIVKSTAHSRSQALAMAIVEAVLYDKKHYGHIRKGYM